MAKRERIEDLGRVSQKLYDIISKIDDLNHFLQGMTKAPPEDVVGDMIRDVMVIKEMAEDAWSIARFGDDEDMIEDIGLGDFEW